MAPGSRWRNRIVGSGEEAPDQLLANPRNWRRHPAAQRDAIRGSLDEVGWVQQVIVNRRTGFVVDGHARIEEAISRAEPAVPVLYVDLTDEEERLVIATLDPIGAMAESSREALEALLAETQTADAALTQLLTDIAPLPERPDFHALIDEFGQAKSGTEKDANWLYIEYYGDDDAFAAVRGALAGHMKGEHEIDPAYFRELVGAGDAA